MDDLLNTLAMLPLLFGMFIVPALLCGMVLASPSLVLVLVQRFSRRHFPRFSSAVIGVMGIFSFAVALLFTTSYYIQMIYALGIPGSPEGEVKQFYYSAVIDEATYQSLVPEPFQKPCTRIPERICQLVEGATINIYGMPLVNGLVSVTTTIFIGLGAQNRLNRQFAPTQGRMAV